MIIQKRKKNASPGTERPEFTTPPRRHLCYHVQAFFSKYLFSNKAEQTIARSSFLPTQLAIETNHFQTYIELLTIITEKNFKNLIVDIFKLFLSSFVLIVTLDMFIWEIAVKDWEVMEI